jgi:molybdopterin-guanine dinucleotide biosynthesis protein A
MGQDKALIALGDETLLQQTCRVAIACADTVYVVTGWGDRYRPLLPPTVHLLAEPAAEPQGPLVALAHALGQIQADWALVLACDMPNLSAAAFSQWRGDLAELPAEVVAYLPKRGDRWEPLCGFYRVAAGEDLRRSGAAGGRSLQRWLKGRSVAAIPGVDEQMLVNLNTPADWAKWTSSAATGARPIFPWSPAPPA